MFRDNSNLNNKAITPRVQSSSLLNQTQMRPRVQTANNYSAGKDKALASSMKLGNGSAIFST